MKGNVALFCIILIVISSVLEIRAMLKGNCRGCKPKERRVSKSPRPNISPTKRYSPCYLTGTGQVLPSIFWILGAGLRDSRPNLQWRYSSLSPWVRGACIFVIQSRPIFKNDKPELLRSRSCTIQAHVTGKSDLTEIAFSCLNSLDKIHQRKYYLRSILLAFFDYNHPRMYAVV